jgi:hypothetical protein
LRKTVTSQRENSVEFRAHARKPFVLSTSGSFKLSKGMLERPIVILIGDVKF